MDTIAKTFIRDFESKEIRAKWVYDLLMHRDVMSAEISCAGKEENDIIITKKKYICAVDREKKGKHITKKELLKIFNEESMITCALLLNANDMEYVYLYFLQVDENVVIETCSNEVADDLEKLLYYL